MAVRVPWRLRAAAHTSTGRFINRSYRLRPGSEGQARGFSEVFLLDKSTTPSAAQRLSELRHSFLFRAEAALKAAQTCTKTRLKPLALDEATTLRLEAFYRRNRLTILTLLGSGAVVFLWKITVGMEELLVGVSDSWMQLALLGLVTTSVACTGLALRSRHSVNPEAVYGVVMKKLHGSAGFMEVMGRPVVGGKVRAYFTSGGDLKIKELIPRMSCSRCFIVFPVQGYDRRALVSSEVVKENGQYHVKLLAADVFMPDSDERFYLIGDCLAFAASGGPFSDLRDPIFKATAAQQEFDDLDEIEAKQSRQMKKAKKKWLVKLVTIVRRVQERMNLSNHPRSAR